MLEDAFGLALGIYVFWVISILTALFMMMTDRRGAYTVVAAVLFGSDAIALVVVLGLIAQYAGAL